MKGLYESIYFDVKKGVSKLSYYLVHIKACLYKYVTKL